MGITKSQRILIVDDEPLILKFLSKLLTLNDFHVDTAANGEEAILKIGTKNYDLIITDMKMPGISGEQVLTYIKTSKNQSASIIGMSGTPWRLNDNLFDAVLPKPFSNNELFKCLEDLLSRQPNKD